jgi:2-oxo-4-hydroxy-4-carboxy-5-ureidoimidazoline decarboxylase
VITLTALNRMDREEFVHTLTGVFEHSTWIPAACFETRPFASIEALHSRMLEVVSKATEGEKLGLLNAHPELADKTSRAAPLTAESSAEQASVGLAHLARDEAMHLASLNQRYRDRFGFPFIIAVRGQRDRQAVLHALETRTNNVYVQEIETALGEVGKIAWFRLADLIQP